MYAEKRDQPSSSDENLGRWILGGVVLLVIAAGAWYWVKRGKEAPEAPPVVAVLLDRVLVVDAGHQALVGEVQERHAGGLVDAPALGLDDAVLDLVRHAQAVPPADRVGLQDQVDGGAELLAVDGDRPALLEADFPQRLRDLLDGPPAPPRLADAATHAPQVGGASFPESPRELDTPLLWLILALFALERWFATRQRAEASA